MQYSTGAYAGLSAHPAIGPYRELTERWLIADRDAPPKQRHTARRIYQRLVDEEGADLAELTVRAYVKKTKRELGFDTPEAFCPQVHLPGRGADVDWGEAEVLIGGSPVKVNLELPRFSGGRSPCPRNRGSPTPPSNLKLSTSPP